MSSHGTNAADELQLLRKAVQERDAYIRVLQNITSETLSGSNESMLSVRQGTGCTDAQHAEAEATNASLRRKLRTSDAMLATTQRSMETQRRYAIEDMESMVDKADSSLDRANAGGTLTPVQSIELFTTTLEEISAKGRAFLHQADKSLQSELKEPQSHKASLPSIQPPEIIALAGDQPHKVQGPTSAPNSFARLAFGPGAAMPPVVPQPQAPRLVAGFDPKPVSALEATVSSIGPQLLVSKVPSESVSPGSRAKGVSASIAPRLPRHRQLFQEPEPKPSTSSTDPIFPPLALSGNDVTGQRKDAAPDTRVDLPMPNKRGANAKPMSTEKARQDTTGEPSLRSLLMQPPRAPLSARDATVSQLRVPMESPKSVSPWSRSEGTPAPADQRQEKRHVQAPKPSLFAPRPTSFKPFVHGSGNDTAGRIEDMAPEGLAKLSMPDTGRANAKRKSTEELRQDTQKRVATNTFTPVVAEQVSLISLLKQLPRAPLSARDTHKLTNSAEELEFAEEEDSDDVSDDKANPRKRKRSKTCQTMRL